MVSNLLAMASNLEVPLNKTSKRSLVRSASLLAACYLRKNAPLPGSIQKFVTFDTDFGELSEMVSGGRR